MSTIEKLFVQIFDRKRSIIEQLKQHKQRYDEYLASKLVIQGVTPPPWLLNSELSSSTSDIAELISGILLPCPGPNETCAKTCASSNVLEGDKPSIIPSYHADRTEDGAAIVPPSHDNDTQDTLNYVPMSPEDQTDTMNLNTYMKQEGSLAGIQRSRSRQKALQLRNSAKASGKSCLGKENNDGIPSGNKGLGYDQPCDGIRKPFELSGPLTLPTRISEEAVLGDCSDKELRINGRSDSSSQSRHNEAKEVQTEDEEKMEKQSNVDVGRNTRSRSYCSKSITGDHESNRKSHEIYSGRVTRSSSGKAQLAETEDPLKRRVTRSSSSEIPHINGNQAIENKVNGGRITKPRSSGANKVQIEDHKSRTKNEMSVKPKQLDFDEGEETCLADILVLGDCSDKELRINACSDSSSQSRRNEAKEVQTEDEEKMEKQSNLNVGRNTRSRSCCSKSITGDHGSNRKTHEIYNGRVTRSRSGKAQLPETEDPLNRRVTRSSSSQIQHINGNQAIENKVNSGRITKPRSSGANKVQIEDHNSRTKNEMSVKPKQLDFDEGEETRLADILTEGKGHLEEKTKEKSATLPCAILAERMSGKRKSLEFETQEVLEIEVDPSLPRSDRISRHTSLLDCRADSQGTEEPMIGTTVEYAADPSLSIPNVDIATGLSSQKRKYEPEEEQELNKGTSCLSLPNADSEPTMSLHGDAVEPTLSSHGDAVEPTLSSEKARHRLSCCNDSNETSYVGLPNPDTKATMSLHRDAVEATVSPEQTLDETRSERASGMLKSGSQECNAGMQNPCFSGNVEEVGCSELPEDRAGIDVLPEYDVNNAIDRSWPCFKRRKIGYQVHYKSASPRVRMNTFLGSNGSIPNESLDGEKENSSCISQKLIISQGSDGVFLNPELVATAADGVKYLYSEEPELAPKVQHEEGKISLESTVMMPFTCEEKQLSAFRVSNVKQDITAEPLDCFSEIEFREAPTSTVQRSGRLCNDLEFAEVVGQANSTEELIFTKTILDKHDAVESVPEFESFIIAGKRESVHNAAYELLNGKIPFPSEIADCTTLPEQIGRPPTSLSTPSSPFPTAYTPGVYRSVPNGLIEKIDLTRNLLSNDDALQGKSYSDGCSFPGRRLGCDFAKPFISPVGKGFEGIASKSGGSDKQLSSNPEYICFPIQEDPETSEEDVNVSDISGTEINGADSNERIGPVREPLRDITAEDTNIVASSHEVERGSLESVTTEIGIVEKHKKDSKKSEMHQRSRQTRQGKTNQSLSIGANSIKKHSESLSSRYSKPKLSGKSSLRSRGASLSEKEPKRNNIVSNLKSFIPLVRQQQESSVVPAKREVKVKALEAAEANKRLQEIRENERKQKKEAQKLQQAKLKQEKLKQMELDKKLKEEERKKREAENAAKKRQREEEERKEKQRKKQRIEEARCQQKQAEEKIHAWREQSRSENEDGRTHERKCSGDKVDKAPEKENISRNPVNELVGSDGRETDNALPSTNDNKSSTGSSDTGKVGNIDVADISTPHGDKTDKRINQTSQEQSYDISPYQCSDDEEEEDDIPSKKFIPTWASKSGVAVALASLKHLDPDTIFPPGSFCSLEEVLLPRRLVQK